MFTNIFCVTIVSLSFIYPANIILDHALPNLSDYKFFKHPIRDQIPENIKEQLIVELYSK